MYRDYAPLGVKFYFVYKALAHPELNGGYVQPITLEERLSHARQAEKQLGASIPWLVDGMDNRLKHALGDRPNSEFLISPDGVILRKRAWSHPGQTRKDLEELVGPVKQITEVSHVRLKTELPLQPSAPRGVLPRVDRTRMQAIRARPLTDPPGLPFYAKLRAEADPRLLRSGRGDLYLGFHLDPFHHAHWNNLTEPLSFEVDLPEGVELEPRSATAPRVEAASDADPREFLLRVNHWPADVTLRVRVKYFACEGEQACHAVSQEYELIRLPDRDAGRVRSKPAPK